MDSKQLTEERLEEELSHYASVFMSDGDDDVFNPKINTLKPSIIDDEIVDILKQRKRHRDMLLHFLIHLTKDIVALFIVLVSAQVGFKVVLNVDVIPESTMSIIAVSMFAEVILTVRGITKALWDEKDVLSSTLIEKSRSDQTSLQ